VKRSRRLLPVCQLKEQAERAEARKLADLQRELEQARRQQQELQGYLQEYFQTIQSQQQQVTQASQLGLYQAFISRLQAAIGRQEELVRQRQSAVQAQSRKWVEANARRKSMEQLVERARQEEALEESRREQKSQDDRPYRGGNPF